MTPELWSTLSPAQQAEHCWRELSAMISAALRADWQPGNAETLVVPGLTTLIGPVEERD